MKNVMFILVIFFILLFYPPHPGWLRAEEPASFNHREYFVTDASPEPVHITGNPLLYAARRIGLDIYNYELPRAYENNYRFACRFPVIDAVANRPLYMNQWTEDTSRNIIFQHEQHGIGVISDALELLRGTADFPGYSGILQLDSLNEFRNRLTASPFSASFKPVVEKLYERYLVALELTFMARANLSRADLNFFLSNPGYFLAPDGERMPPLTGDVSTQFTFIEKARLVKYEYIFAAAELFSAAVHEYVSTTAGFNTEDFFIDDADLDEQFVFETPVGLLLISGTGNDRHADDACILIDLGGNDHYYNNAGGCRTGKEGLALCIDHGGNDAYKTPDNRYVQGFGFLGTGFLVDIAGNDSYDAAHFSQGTGIMGVGAILDLAGDDRYEGQSVCQGAGMFGLGMVLDNGGEDYYDCASLGQGSATTLGIGILSDLQGDDRYHLGVRHDRDSLGQSPGFGQGGALSFRHYPWKGKLTSYGGAGLLFDKSGNDRYRSKGWCDQGGSYIMSLGALVDFAGNDHYTSSTGQGSGIHITNAILIDHDGHDVYEGRFRAGASGSDRSPGFLIDYHGNDMYRSRTSSYGTGCKPHCVSLFIDYEGDDAYLCAEPEGPITFNNWDSFGGVWPESDPVSWPFAMCLDLGGRDDYQVRNRKNNSERHSFGHGIHVDTNWNGGDVIGNIENPLEDFNELPLPKQVRKSPYYEHIRML